MSADTSDIRDAGPVSVCHSCGKRWAASVLVCPEDGAPLALHTGDIEISASLRADPTPMVEARSERVPVGTVVGEYVVEGRLGQGGMGAVYAASHPLIGKKAAIKVISLALCTDSAAVERFVQEARSVNQIGHPNIVDIFSFGELIDGRCYFVMELLVGETLGERLARGRLPLAEAIEILDQVADALDAAHEAQIVHRDLKPDNVYLVSVRGNRQLAKLLDFGIAKLAGSVNESQRPSLTKTGFVMGSPGYISPEQARGRPVDQRSDIYALGALAFEMLCGRQVFTADNVTDLVILHCTEPPPRPSSVDPGLPRVLDDLLTRMLEKDPAARPTMQEIRAGLRESYASLTSRPVSSGHELPEQTVVEPRLRRGRWPIYSALGVACALGAVFSIYGLDLRGAKTGHHPPVPQPIRLAATAPPLSTPSVVAPFEALPHEPSPPEASSLVAPSPAARPAADRDSAASAKPTPRKRKLARGRASRSAAPATTTTAPTDDAYMLNPFRDPGRK